MVVMYHKFVWLDFVVCACVFVFVTVERWEEIFVNTVGIKNDLRHKGDSDAPHFSLVCDDDVP